MDRVRVAVAERPRDAAGRGGDRARVAVDPVAQAALVAFLALVIAQAGQAAGWFAVSLLAGVSLSGSI